MIHVLRLSHRPFRDKRISTHCALVSRAFGASAIVYSGMKDSKMEQTIQKTVSNFGGDFTISYEKDPISVIKKYKSQGYLIVHLTVYGEDFRKKMPSLAKKNILLVVGSEKVEPEFYNLADYNIAISSQPHSEVSALSIFLHSYFGGSELDLDFKNSTLKIIPQKRGKNVQQN